MNGRGVAALMAFASSMCALAAVPDAAADASKHAETGVQYARDGNLVRAEEELRRAVKLVPNDASYLTSLGGILGMQEKFAEANVYFEQAVTLDPNNAPARRNLAANEWRLGQLKPAQANLETLLRTQPDDQAATLLLGMVLENEHEYARAAKLLSSVSDLVSQRPESLAALANSYYHTGQRAEGHNVLEALLGRTVAPQGIFAAAGIAAQAKDYGIAEQLFESIRTTYPDPARVDYNLALIYGLKGHEAMKRDEFTDAVQSFSRAVKLDPKSLDAQVGLASAKWAAGMRSEAEAQFQTLVKEHPRDAIVDETYGRSLLNSATDDAALSRASQLLTQATRLDPSRPEPHFELGTLELKRSTGDASAASLHRACEQLETAARLGMNDSQLHYALARVYRRLGREGDATQQMRLYEDMKAIESK